MKAPKVLAFGGSLRSGSYNQKLATLAAEHLRQAGADVKLIALRDYWLPLFDEDLEKAEGMPDNGTKLKQMFAEHDGFLIASPEYNSGITGALKNTIDWVSRVTSADEKPLSVFRGKFAGIVAASPGGYGGSRGLAQLRPLLENIYVTVVKEQLSVAKANEAFDDNGRFKDPKHGEELAAVCKSLVESLKAK